MKALSLAVNVSLFCLYTSTFAFQPVYTRMCRWFLTPSGLLLSFQGWRSEGMSRFCVTLHSVASVWVHLWSLPLLVGPTSASVPLLRCSDGGSQHTWRASALLASSRVPRSSSSPALHCLLLWVPLCLGHLLKIRLLGPPPEQLLQAPGGTLCSSLGAVRGMGWVGSPWEPSSL